MRHMLLYHDNRFAQDLPLSVFHLADVKMRHAVNLAVAARVKTNASSFVEFTALVIDPNFGAKLEAARASPDGPDAREVTEKVLKFIRLSGGSIPLSSSQIKGSDMIALIAAHRAYGPAGVFLSIAPDDVHDALVIRLAHAHAGGAAFPAVATPEFTAALRAQKPDERAPVGGPQMDERTLQKLAAANPVATTLAFDRLIRHVLEHLIGVDPCAKKTSTVDELRKGVFGTQLMTNFVKELNERECAHVHGQLHGGVLPAFLAHVVHDAALAEDALRAIDSQVRSELPLEYHALAVAFKVLKVGKRRDAAFPVPTPRPLEDDRAAADAGADAAPFDAAA
jgi:hypothetical protein